MYKLYMYITAIDMTIKLIMSSSNDAESDSRIHQFLVPRTATTLDKKKNIMDFF
jgi:hypothetical protein